MSATVKIGSVLSFPVGPRHSKFPSALICDMCPTQEAGHVRLDMTMAVMPVTFVTYDGRPTGFPVGCTEANFALNIDPGNILVEDAAAPPLLRFVRTVETAHERGTEIRPKLEMKAGTEGVGVGGEVGALSTKVIDSDGLEVRGSDDRWLVRTIRRYKRGWIQWVITPSPLAGRGAIVQGSCDVDVCCSWPTERKGTMSLYGRCYVACDAGKALRGGHALAARLIHWVNGRTYRNDLLPQQFEISAGAA
jgi:hypothetical protein